MDHFCQTALGGSAALIEFFLRHRKANDIDLFVVDEIGREQTVSLIGNYWPIHKVSQSHNGRAIQYSVQMGQEEVLVHITILKDRWFRNGIIETYSIDIQGITIHRAEYIAAEKFNGSSEMWTSFQEREKNIFDLVCILKAGMTVKSLVAAIRELDFHPPFDDCLESLPEAGHIDGLCYDLSEYERIYVPELRKAWYRR